ncbi:PREDICTED: uncharacterized protein LOC109206335 [Nicotiana attenuata]|uniref:uncharacterized protein LOC109206335 n=1 Tax=Nicotiana attenuata TaxID=49451 RepID=UPI0009050ACA|nr:PREDICTED: uncharacterized protein LOC109206335 [Nicotiana attenuata]
MAPKAPKDPNAAKVGKAPKAPRQPIIPPGPYVPAPPLTRPGQRYFEFGDWFNCKGYWKGNHDLKKLIATFLTPTQRDKLNNGTFRYIMAMENFQCSMKLVHCLCLSRIFTNDRDSISFKIFGHDVSFTLEDFHIMCGLRITTHNVEKPINRESNILKRYFGKSKGVTLKDIRSFMTRNEIPKNAVNHVNICETDDDAVKLMEILVVESIFFGNNTESSVMEEYASIVEDDKVCAEYPWGNVAYEKLIYSLKHALDKQNKLHTTEYKVGGFPYPLCAWFYERFPDVRAKYIREDEYLDTPQVPRMLRYVCVGEPKFPELFHMFSTHEGYRNFRVGNAVPSTGESPRTLSRSKEANRGPVIGESPQVNDGGSKAERSTIVNEVFDKFKKDERSAIVDAVFVKVKEYFDEKFEQLFKIVNKSNEMDDDKVADINATHEEAAFEGDQHVHEQAEEERSSADRLSRDGNDEEQLATENVGSKQCADNQVEEDAAHDPSRKVADDNATRKEAAGECDEHVQQQGADDQVVGTEKHAPSCSLESDIGQGNLCDTQEIVTTAEVETSCASIDTTQKHSDDAELNEGRVEKNLPQNIPMLLDVGAQLNEAGNADIEKGMQPGETTAEDKRQEILEAAQKEFGELMQQYQKGKIHLFTTVGSQTDTGISKGKGNGSVRMQTPSVSQHLDRISSDALQLLPNPKRRKISSSPMCDTSDIPNFNLCSFSLGSTQGTDSEGNSAVVVVREEIQEHREQH